MNLPFRLAAAVIVALALATPARAAAVEYPPGSRIGLVPPPGMTASKRLQGFEDPARGAVMAITELSAQSYPHVAREFSPRRCGRAAWRWLSARNTTCPAVRP